VIVDRMPVEQRSDAAPDNGAVTKTSTDVRQGVKLGVMRWVLGISVALAIVGVAIALLIARQ
jgi:hypothetical protein